jgi:signal transduction histidine kinase
MKLFSTYNKLNLAATVLIFVLASIAYYFLLRYVIISQLDENLNIEQDEIETFVSKYNRLPEIITVKDQTISFTSKEKPVAKRFVTKVAYDTIENDSSEFRELQFSVSIDKNRWFLASVGKSMEGTENLIKSIIVITICTISLILLTSLIINRLVLNKLWQPFYHTLQLLKDFKVGSKDSVHLPSSTIEEFSLMNNIIQQAINMADHDYRLLKEFTENASHEIQTPLTIIRSKIDLLIQEENLSEKHGDNLDALYRAIEKLSKLNKSLLLLTKIENNQFTDVTEIDLKEKIEDKLLQFQEIIIGKNITVKIQLEAKTILMNADLVDILLNNLISNSIKHNFNGGSINIILTKGGKLLLTNTSAGRALNGERMFTRFYKEVENKEHTGLGLSILKQICLVSNCSISYQFRSGFHNFSIQW